jgi:hypothetical protein
MRPLYLGGHRLKTLDDAMGTTRGWRTVDTKAQRKTRDFHVDEYIGHGDAGTGPVSQWFKNVFVRTSRAIFGAGLDPEHME